MGLYYAYLLTLTYGMQAKAASQAGQARRSASHVAQLAVGKPACMPIALCILTQLWQLGHYAYILALTYGIKVIATSQTGQPACQLPTRQPSSRTTQPASQPKKNESSKQAIKQTSEKHTNQPNNNHPKRPVNQPTKQHTKNQKADKPNKRPCKRTSKITQNKCA